MTKHIHTYFLLGCYAFSSFFFFFNLVQKKKKKDDFRAGHVEACSGEAKSRLVQGREVNPALQKGLCSERGAVAPSIQVGKKK